ncbi:helix-turn-helix transcriptional regulator [Hymenobacter sp. HSC-4F20]|uniref:helix-turn-helix transcriptional regulator n=1 Tax=Hymenobacter sp. HSC-4F20 TaxID=2864135 RepID=UPI002175B9B3|nr:helix-turn-helix transcriptional regulator [Hymenobacter sp. HSC-4F20]
MVDVRRLLVYSRVNKGGNVTADEFRAARLGIGQDTQQLADAVGLSRQTVSMMENGKRGISQVTKQKLIPLIDSHIKELRKIRRKLKNTC